MRYHLVSPSGNIDYNSIILASSKACSKNGNNAN